MMIPTVGHGAQLADTTLIPPNISGLWRIVIRPVSGELLREPIVQAIAPYSVGVNDEIPRNAL
jgi:hypothetical protein